MTSVTRKHHSRSRERAGYLFILPWIIGFLIFTAYPIFYSLYLSFFKVTIGASGIVTVFMGIGNYVRAIAGDMNFMTQVGSYLSQVFIAAILIIILSLLIAMMLNQKFHGIGVFRTIYFLPVIIASGPVLQKMQDMGIVSIQGLNDFSLMDWANNNPQFVVTSLLSYVMNNLVILLWFTGVPILIFLAALQKRDTAVIEAAHMDGAGAWAIFWKLTLPSLSSMILVNMVYVIVTYSTSAMNPIIANIQSNLFSTAPGSGMGYAAAQAWVYFIVVALVIGVAAGVLTFFNRRGARK
jgi:ABC-type sugar transport system permease subunit